MRAALRDRLASIGHAAAGARLLLRREPNARVHLCATAAACALGYALQLTASDWGFLVVAMALVWIAEALNTALELLVLLPRMPDVAR